MPRRPAPRPHIRAGRTVAPKPTSLQRHLITASRTQLLAGLGAIALLATVLVWIWSLMSRSPARLQAYAKTAAQAGDWKTALRYWQALNATGAARGSTHLEEARAYLALSRAARAERTLRRSTRADPTNVEAWRLLLQILQVENRTLEAQALGWQAYAHVPPGERRELLRAMMLALLADVPDQLARTTLRRWADADPTDIDARVALLERIAAQPRAADPDRPALLVELESILARDPRHTGVRAALTAALADAGEPDRGRAVLNGWPESAHDARYWQLRGRWELEYEHRPARAVGPFQTALSTLPQDWRSWYRLSRALHMLGRDRESRQAAETVGRIREVLDPLTLGPRLDAAVNHLDDPATLEDLATLCTRAGLTRLANAWHAEAQTHTQPNSSDTPSPSTK